MLIARADAKEDAEARELRQKLLEFVECSLCDGQVMRYEANNVPLMGRKTLPDFGRVFLFSGKYATSAIE